MAVSVTCLRTWSDVTMSDIEVSRVIAAPAELLYDIVSDLPNMGELSPENTGGVWVKGATGPAVGARFRGTNSNEKKHWATTVIIDEADRGQAFTFRVVVGPVKVARWGYRFEQVAGGTKVTETWDDMRNSLSKKAGSMASGVNDRPTHNREAMEVTLVNLARAAAARQSPAT
jgi:hypothetical protein